jgi:hypothetical protein
MPITSIRAGAERGPRVGFYDPRHRVDHPEERAETLGQEVVAEGFSSIAGRSGWLH